MILTQEAIRYTIGCVARIAFPKKQFDVVFGDVPELVVDGGPVVEFQLPRESDLELLFSENALYSEVKSYDGKVLVKVFSLDQNADLFSFVGGKVRVNFDMISVAFLLLSRFEETMTERRDKNGRFCFDDSLCAKYELIDVPVVDEYAMLLRKFVEDNVPDFSVERQVARFVPTHDIDFLFRFPNFSKAMKTIAGDLIKRKSFGTSCRSLSAYMKSLKDYKRDPYVNAVLELIKVSVENKLDTQFYFKALGKRNGDCTYDIFSPKTKACMKYFKSLGVSFGLHGSYGSYADKAALGNEKKNLESVCGNKVFYGRQHFLRFDVNQTPQVWQSVGLRDDFTLGFPEHEGFRCGTCHHYPLFDIANNCELEVVEHPLVVMDTTLYQYRKLTVEEAYRNVCRLYERCVSVEGDFVMLWHNTSMFGELRGWYENVYLRFLKMLEG